MSCSFRVPVRNRLLGQPKAWPWVKITWAFSLQKPKCYFPGISLIFTLQLRMNCVTLLNFFLRILIKNDFYLSPVECFYNFPL
jgi:hypothetical protein